MLSAMVQQHSMIGGNLRTNNIFLIEMGLQWFKNLILTG
jgi:hypothetical protein